MQTTGNAEVTATKEMLINIFRDHSDMFRSNDKSALSVYAGTIIAALKRQEEDSQ